MKLKTLTLTMQSDKTINGNATKLRGFFATEFNEYTLLHQHLEGDKFLYKYPHIQYKIMDNTPLILGIEKGIDVLKKIYDKYHSVKLNGHTCNIMEKSIILKEEEFGFSKKFLLYHFLTPWLALNERNYERYKNSNQREQIQLLKKILIGNILSTAKGLDYVVTKEIKVKNLKLKMQNIRVKDIKMIGFVGDFEVNFNLPEIILVWVNRFQERLGR